MTKTSPADLRDPKRFLSLAEFSASSGLSLATINRYLASGLVKQHEICARFDHAMRTQKFGRCVAGRSFLSLFEAEVAGRAKSLDNVEPMNQLRFVSVLAQWTVSIKLRRRK